MSSSVILNCEKYSDAIRECDFVQDLKMVLQAIIPMYNDNVELIMELNIEIWPKC